MGKLFVAGVVPGLLLGVILMVVIYIVARVKKLPAQPRASFREWLAAARRAGWGLLLLVIILGGIYSGLFTPTEAAAVAAVYSAFVALFVYKDMRLRDCPKVLLESGRLSIMLMFIIANAMLFAHVLTTEQIPQQITEWVVQEGLTPIGFLLMVNVVLLVAGSFMEPSAIVLILAPIFFPIARWWCSIATTTAASTNRRWNSTPPGAWFRARAFTPMAYATTPPPAWWNSTTSTRWRPPSPMATSPRCSPNPS